MVQEGMASLRPFESQLDWSKREAEGLVRSLSQSSDGGVWYPEEALRQQQKTRVQRPFGREENRLMTSACQ